jgi:TolB protein
MRRIVVVGLLALLIAAPSASSASGRNGLVAFVRETNDGSDEIHVVTPGGKAEKFVVAGSAPAWSPDGRRFAFQAAVEREDGDVDFDLFVANADGSDLRHIDRPGADDIMPSWSSDGAHLAFARDEDTTRDNISVFSEICVVRIDGSGFRQLTHNSVREFAPAWSPNGKWIAWDRAPSFGDIWIMRADGTRKRRLAGTAGWDDAPSWAPDGTEIAFDTDGPRAVAGIDVWSLKRRRLRHVAGTRGSDSGPAWSPDGRMLAFTRTSAADDVYVIGVRGGRPRRLVHDGFTPAWQPRR